MENLLQRTALALIFMLGISSTHSLSSSEVTRKLENYDKTQPPYNNRPTEVKVGIYAFSLDIDDAKMEMEVIMYFRQAWRDPRLNFGKKFRMFDTSLIWKPDTFFRNDGKDALQSVPAGLQLLRVNETGHVWFVQRTVAKFSCPMSLQRFPADRQMCRIMIESFGYTMDVMYFSLLDSPIGVDTNLRLPKFMLDDTILYDCSQNYTSGAYPCLEFRFLFKRETGFFIKRIYMPTSVIVLLSTSPFWLPSDHPGRVPVALLTTLTMTVYASVTRGYYQSASVSEVTLLDVWLGGCVLIALAAFVVQLAGVIVVKKSSHQQDVSAGEKSSTVRERLCGSKIDLIGKILFPAVFLLFIIIYACI